MKLANEICEKEPKLKMQNSQTRTWRPPWRMVETKCFRFSYGTKDTEQEIDYIKILSLNQLRKRLIDLTSWIMRETPTMDMKMKGSTFQRK